MYLTKSFRKQLKPQRSCDGLKKNESLESITKDYNLKENTIIKMAEKNGKKIDVNTITSYMNKWNQFKSHKLKLKK